MPRSRLPLMLAGSGIALFIAFRTADAPPAIIAAVGLIGMALTAHYDPAIEELLRGRRWPVPRDAGLWLLASAAAIGVCGGVDWIMRPPGGDPMARAEWALQLIGSLLPAVPILAAARFDRGGDRPRLWPIAAALGAWVLYWTAGWLTWTLVTTASIDPLKVTPALALWMALPLSPLLAIAALLWWRAYRQSPHRRFDDTGMFRSVIVSVMAAIAVLLAIAGVLLLTHQWRPAGFAKTSATVAWLLAALVAAPWLRVLARVRDVAPRRAVGAVAATAVLVLSLGASFVIPIGFAETHEWWQIFLLFLAPVLVAVVGIVLKGVPRVMIAALRL